MKTISSISCIGICITLFGLLSCGNNPVAHNGGSSTETARISGTFYKTDGTVAKNIAVYLRKQNTLADTSVGILAKKAAFSADTVITSDSGTFVLDSLDTGTYVVEGTDGNNNLVRIDSIKITATDSIRTLPPDTLKPAGAIKGIIKLSEGGDSRKVFVLAFGVDRFARVNADGSFKFTGLAEGKYDLRLISSLDSYGVLDTLNIQVRSADTNDMDSIELPFVGIPIPKNVALGYDTMNQIVTLKWSKADTSLVSSYNVYRRNVDSNTVLTRINVSPVTDTVYHDSTGVQDKTYEYCVASVNKNASEGTKSAMVSVKVTGAYSVMKTISNSTIADPRDLKVLANGNIIFVEYDESCLKTIDINGAIVNKIILTDSLGHYINGVRGLTIDQALNYYVASDNGAIKYDSIGKFVATFDSIQYPDVPYNIAMSDSFIFITQSHAIVKFDINGRFISKFANNEFAQGYLLQASGIVVSSDSLFVFDQLDAKMKIYSTNGKFLSEWGGIGTKDGQFTQTVTKIALDSKGNIVIAQQEMGKVQIVRKDGIIICKFFTNGLNNTPNGLTLDSYDNIYMSIRPTETNVSSIQMYKR